MSFFSSYTALGRGLAFFCAVADVLPHKAKVHKARVVRIVFVFISMLVFMLFSLVDKSLSGVSLSVSSLWGVRRAKRGLLLLLPV